MSVPSALLLFLGDPAHDRRVQNFHRLFENAGFRTRVVAGYHDASSPNLNLKYAAGPRRFLEFDRTVRSVLARERCDVVVACDLYSLSAAARMRKRGDARLLIYDAREVYTELPTVADRALVKSYWRRAERHGLMQVDRIIVTARHDLQAILDVHQFAPQSLLIRNLPWREPSLKPNHQLLVACGIPIGSKVIVYVGGLQAGRGLLPLVTAMRGRPEHLLLIGDGILRKDLQANAGNNVHFAGAVAAETTMGILAACDVGLSLTESVSKSYALALPSKIFEYMAAGIPVVSSALLHVRELFAGESWITFVHELSDDAIGRAIDSALASSDDPKSRARELALSMETFNFEADGAALIQTVHRLLLD